MIAARQSMHGGGGKPYDAEVEYLESTGTQYIDTGIRFGDQNGLWVDGSFFDCEFLVFSRNAVLFYNTIRAEAKNWFVRVGDFASSRTVVEMGSQIANNPPSPINNFVRVWANTTEAIINGVSCTREEPQPLYAPKTTIVLGKDYTSAIYSFRLKYFKAKGYNGEIDFIPVRKGTVGYMYDRVSGKLFGNQGTGEFAIGPDVEEQAPISAKSYIQDGLIGHWDGIENVGYSKHDNNATVWKDLVGGMDATLQEGAEWNGNALTRGTCTTALAKSNAKISGVQTIEVLFKKGFSSSAQVIVTTGVAQNCFFIRDDSDTLLVCGYGKNSGSFASVFSIDGIYNATAVYTTADTSATCQCGYVNGVALGVGSSSGQGHAASVNMFGGANGTDRPFYGEIFAVRYYNRALTEAEIAHNYAVDKERFGL